MEMCDMGMHIKSSGRLETNGFTQRPLRLVCAGFMKPSTFSGSSVFGQATELYDLCFTALALTNTH